MRTRSALVVHVLGGVSVNPERGFGTNRAGGARACDRISDSMGVCLQLVVQYSSPLFWLRSPVEQRPHHFLLIKTPTTLQPRA